MESNSNSNNNNNSSPASGGDGGNDTKGATPLMAAVPPSSRPQTWKVPEGIEQHIESGLIKAVTGIAVGGIIGWALFRQSSSRNGWRMACMATGLGIALGSTYERASSYNQVSPFTNQPPSSQSK